MIIWGGNECYPCVIMKKTYTSSYWLQTRTHTPGTLYGFISDSVTFTFIDSVWWKSTKLEQPARTFYCTTSPLLSVLISCLIFELTLGLNEWIKNSILGWCYSECSFREPKCAVLSVLAVFFSGSLLQPLISCPAQKDHGRLYQRLRLRAAETDPTHVFGIWKTDSGSLEWA